ncbi:MAG: hypothetical protein JWN40_2105 [Phycisphaerales bacterium]|nr:hypothetical protein [Phycisphaerales bacterium]
MADTAWQLFNKTTRKQADLYLETRAAQGFTVIQAEVNARFPDLAGNSAFVGNDPARPNEAYFKNVDYMIRKANALGMYVALVPVDSQWSANGIFNKENVYQYGKFIGRRYASAKIIWVLGGDVPGNGGGGVDMWRNMAAGITRGAANRDESKVLMTYHPYYAQSSSQWFQKDSWLDFNAIQSGQALNRDNYNMIGADYGRSPARPVMDIEPGYEDIPSGIKSGNQRLTDYDVRKAEYAALFAGAFGVTYGNNNVWQFVTSPGNQRNLATMTWQAALGSMGATSMTYLKRLMLSRPQNRVPDQSLIVGSQMGAADRLQATRGADGSYAFIYSASGKAVTVNLSKLSGTQITARWYNPRAAKSVYVGVFAKSGTRTFKAPSSGVNNDWVLVLDDASKGYGKP